MRRLLFLIVGVLTCFADIARSQTAIWKKVGSLPSNASAIAIFPNDPDSLLITSGAGLFLSSDGGLTWISKGLGGDEVIIDRDPDPKIYRAFEQGGMFVIYWDLYMSTDLNASSIKLVTSGPDEPLRLVLDPSDGRTLYFNAGRMSLGRVSNGGTKVDTVARVDATIDMIWSIQIARARPERIYLGTFNGIYASSDGGSTWKKSYSEFPLLWSITVDHFNENKVYANSNIPSLYQSVMKTENGGDTWIECFKDTTGATLAVYSSPFAPDEVFLAGGVGFEGGSAHLLRSTDAGETWHKYDAGLNETPSLLAFDTINTKVYSVCGLSLYVLDKTSKASDIQNASPAQFSLLQNFPNPFNPSTTISFTVPRTGKVRVTVYDALGRLVTILQDGVLNAGTYERTWNASVPSGMYFYRLEAAPADGSGKLFTETKKMILLK